MNFNEFVRTNEKFARSLRLEDFNENMYNILTQKKSNAEATDDIDDLIEIQTFCKKAKSDLRKNIINYLNVKTKVTNIGCIEPKYYLLNAYIEYSEILYEVEEIISLLNRTDFFNDFDKSYLKDSTPFFTYVYKYGYTDITKKVLKNITHNFDLNILKNLSSDIDLFINELIENFTCDLKYSDRIENEFKYRTENNIPFLYRTPSNNKPIQVSTDKTDKLTPQQLEKRILFKKKMDEAIASELDIVGMVFKNEIDNIKHFRNILNNHLEHVKKSFGSSYIDDEYIISENPIDNDFNENYDSNIFKSFTGFEIFKKFTETKILNPYKDFSFIFYSLFNDGFIRQITHKYYIQWLFENNYIDDNQRNVFYDKGNLCKKSGTKARRFIYETIKKNISE